MAAKKDDVRWVAIAKLREDASEQWRPAAIAIRGIRGRLRELELDEKEFSKFATWTDVPKNYETAWDNYKTLMSQAEKSFDRVANQLMAAADRYDHSEHLNARAIQDAAAGLED